MKGVLQMNNTPVNEVAQRIRELREVCGYSKEKLARELGIDPSVYEDYEKTGENIPISVIYEIANKFKVDFTEIITGVSAKLDTYHLVRSGEGKDVNRYPGYRFSDLAYKFGRKIMQPLLVTLDPSDKPASLVSHAGQEFNMVVEGSVAVVIEDEELILNTGDTIYFNPNLMHGQRCVGDKKAVFLTIIAE